MAQTLTTGYDSFGQRVEAPENSETLPAAIVLGVTE
jgi:hypothetical protein